MLWTGARDSDGYGYLTIRGQRRLVHRVIWEMFEGPIPEGLTLDHVKARGCTNRHCASIAHLEPVTAAENLRRSDLHGFCAANAAKARCDHGHEFDERNTYIAPDGHRSCRACNRIRSARYAARKKAVA